MNRRTIYACSSNKGKLAEFALAAEECREHAFQIESLPGLQDITPPEENGSSFEENAVIKALYYARFASGPVFADDSGLEVDALNGAPGIYSARFAGPGASDDANNRLVLERLCTTGNRSARFVCVIALARQETLLGTYRATVEGEILPAPRGTGGFGYDPLFFYPPLSQTLAEVPARDKFQVSHRGKALCRMLRALHEMPSV